MEGPGELSRKHAEYLKCAETLGKSHLAFNAYPFIDGALKPLAHISLGDDVQRVIKIGCLESTVICITSGWSGTPLVGSIKACTFVDGVMISAEEPVFVVKE